MQSLPVPGSVLTKETAPGYLERVASYLLKDLTLESSVVLSDIERLMVDAGFLTWEECEAIEIAAASS